MMAAALQDTLPRSLQPRAKQALHDIMYINRYDAMVRQRRGGDFRARALFGRLQVNGSSAAHRIGAQRGAVGLSRGGACAAIARTTRDYVISFVVGFLTRVSPGIIHRCDAL
jgi:hypothetical protein